MLLSYSSSSFWLFKILLHHYLKLIIFAQFTFCLMRKVKRRIWLALILSAYWSCLLLFLWLFLLFCLASCVLDRKLIFAVISLLGNVFIPFIFLFPWISFLIPFSFFAMCLGLVYKSHAVFWSTAQLITFKELVTSLNKTYPLCLALLIISQNCSTWFCVCCFSSSLSCP